jgi:RNA polymerase sigma-70 factor (ECF subfamily)
LLKRSPLPIREGLAPRSEPSVGELCLDAFQREVDFVYRSLQRLGAASSDLDDLVQEVFLALCASWSKYDPTRALRPYLFGIAFRIVANHRRKTRHEVACGPVEMEDDRPGPDELLVAKRSGALLLDALERIPLRRRAVLVMHELDGVPVKEVATALGIPLFTVYSRLRKARRELAAAVRNGPRRRR